MDPNGIKRQISYPHTPEQIGVAERKHIHIVEMGLTSLFNANLPLFLWVEAFVTVVFLINRMPSSTLSMESPFSKLHRQSHDYNTLKVFRCRCFPYLKGQNKNKFQPKTLPCVFIGYSLLHKGFRCYHPQSRKVFISQHVIFDELKLPYKSSSADLFA